MKFAGLLLIATVLQADPIIDRARAVLVEGYADKNPETRREVAVAAGLLGSGDKSVDALGKLLSDPDYRVRVAAIAGLADLEPGAAYLEKALEDEVPEVAFSAAKVLWMRRNGAARELLADIVEKEEKGSSNFLAAKIRDTARQFKAPKTALLFGVRQGLGFVPLAGLGAGYSAAHALVIDPDFSVRAVALLLLAAETNPETDKLLYAALVDSDWGMRAAAAQALAQQNRKEHMPALARLFDDKREKVRFRAAAGYLRLAMLSAGH